MDNMSMEHGKRITQLEVLSGRALKLAYSTGEEAVVDFAPIIAEGGVFATLSTDAVFSSVELGAGGTFIEFPGGIDFCADSLLETAQRQVATG